MQTPQGNLSANELHSCLRALCPLLERYSQQRFGDAAETAGWQDFSRWGEAAIAHEKQIYQSVFTAWWLFSWLPDDHYLKGERFLVPTPDHAIAADYLAMHRTKLSQLEQRVIERALKSPYSFYTLVSLESGNRLRLQEIYTQKHVMVEADASAMYSVGDVLFTAVLSVDGMSVLLGCMPQALDAISQARIEAHRQKWGLELGKSIDQRQLYLHDTDLRRYYFVLLQQLQQSTLH